MKEINEDKDGVTDFFMVKKELGDAYGHGKLTFTETMIRLWLPFLADKRGVVHVKSYRILTAKMPKEFKIKPNTVGKCLKSLMCHKYLWYDAGQGIRSGFKVQLLPWPIADHKALTADDFFEKPEITSKIGSDAGSSSQVIVVGSDKNHKSNLHKGVSFSTQSPSAISEKIIGSYNDRNKEKNNPIATIKRNDEDIPVAGFRVNTYEESRLVYFAQLCGDRYMNFYLGKYKARGDEAVKAMERAEVKYKETDLSTITNKPGFFNSLICKELGEEPQATSSLKNNNA